MNNTPDDILRGIGIKVTREEIKEVLRQYKHDGRTKNEVESLYAAVVMTNQTCKGLLPVMLLWIEEVYGEEEKNEST